MTRACSAWLNALAISASAIGAMAALAQSVVGNLMIISISCEARSPSGPRLIIACLACKNDNGKG
jgi:hypothetical protein